MALRAPALILFAAALAGCSGASFGPPAPPAGDGVAPGAPLGPSAALQPGKKQRHYAYWTLFASCSYPQVQFARAPMKSTSKTTSYDCSKQNGLHYTSGLGVDSLGRLWVLSFSRSGASPT